MAEDAGNRDLDKFFTDAAFDTSRNNGPRRQLVDNKKIVFI